MSKFFGENNMAHMFPSEQTLVLNKNNELIRSILKLKDKEDKKEDVDMMCRHIYDLAMMSHKQLEPEAMTKFIERSNRLLARLAQTEAAG